MNESTSTRGVSCSARVGRLLRLPRSKERAASPRHEKQVTSRRRARAQRLLSSRPSGNEVHRLEERHPGRPAVRPHRPARPLAPVAASRTSSSARRAVRGLPGARVPRPGPPVRGRGHGPDVLAAVERLARAPPGGGGVKVLLWHVHGSWTTRSSRATTTTSCRSLPDRGPDGRAARGPRTGPRRCASAARASCATRTFDVVLLQRPHELDHLAEDWLGPPAGPRLPAVYVEHNAPAGADRRDAPPGGRPRRPRRPRHPLQRALLGRRHDADARDRARHRRPRPALHGRARRAPRS